MNASKENRMIVSAYNRGWDDAYHNRGNRKSKEKKQNRKAYSNGYTEGQRQRGISNVNISWCSTWERLSKRKSKKSSLNKHFNPNKDVIENLTRKQIEEHIQQGEPTQSLDQFREDKHV